MKEQLINEVITEVRGLTPDQLCDLRETLVCVLSKYKVEEEERHLTIYQGYLPSCFKAYFAVKSIEGLSIKTLKLYKLYLEHFFRLVNKPLDKIDVNDIRLFLHEYGKDGRNSKCTLDTVRACISAFFKWADAEGYCPKNPCASLAPIKYERHQRVPLSSIELEQLREASSKDVRDNLIIEFFYSTGCRVSEFVGVKVTDIDIAKGQCLVLGKGNKHRIVYINARCQLAIERYLWATNRDFSSDTFLIRPMRGQKDEAVNIRSIESRVHQLGIMAGLKRKLHPHLIRHTTATDGITRGMPVEQVQKMLGHSSIATTMIYAHVSEDNLQTEHKRCIV